MDLSADETYATPMCLNPFSQGVVQMDLEQCMLGDFALMS